MTFLFFSILLIMTGLIIGLGAVTVIDIHGYLGRKSAYWTLATTRTHKVTKPLIWIGIGLAIIGGGMYYSTIGWNIFATVHLCLAIILILNGCFLSFVVSPHLLQREKDGKDREILATSLQRKITVGFIVSCIGWWTSVALFAWQFAQIASST